MKRLGPLAFVVGVLIWSATGGAGPARAADHSPAAKAAREHLQRGDAFFKLERYKDALTEYEQGYLGKAEPGFLYDIAQCHRLMGDKQAALRFYKRFIDAAPKNPNRELAEKQIHDLEGGGGKAAAAPVVAAKPSAPAPKPAPVPVAAKPAPAPAPAKPAPAPAPVAAKPAPAPAKPAPAPVAAKPAPAPAPVKPAPAPVAAKPAPKPAPVAAKPAPAPVVAKPAPAPEPKPATKPATAATASTSPPPKPATSPPPVTSSSSSSSSSSSGTAPPPLVLTAPPPSSSASSSPIIDAPETVHANAEPEQHRPVYTKWWFWAAIAVVVAAGSVGVYLALPKDPTCDPDRACR